jgi:uncharacterized tellurite resistance protein B-like protein
MERVKAGFAAEPGNEERKQHDQLRLATAAVLLDIAYADEEFHPAETGETLAYLQNAFQLSPDDARELLEAADGIRNHTIDHFAVTNYIRKNTSLSQRIDLVKTLWRLAYSDGKLAEYEGYLVRKLADLLGLEHHVMIDAKVAVLREREGT